MLCRILAGEWGRHEEEALPDYGPCCAAIEEGQEKHFSPGLPEHSAGSCGGTCYQTGQWRHGRLYWLRTHHCGGLPKGQQLWRHPQGASPFNIEQFCFCHAVQSNRGGEAQLSGYFHLATHAKNMASSGCSTVTCCLNAFAWLCRTRGQQRPRGLMAAHGCGAQHSTR